jgi:hypothetical protein
VASDFLCNRSARYAGRIRWWRYGFPSYDEGIASHIDTFSYRIPNAVIVDLVGGV